MSDPHEYTFDIHRTIEESITISVVLFGDDSIDQALKVATLSAESSKLWNRRRNDIAVLYCTVKPVHPAD